MWDLGSAVPAKGKNVMQRIFADSRPGLPKFPYDSILLAYKKYTYSGLVEGMILIEPETSKQQCAWEPGAA